MFGTDGRAKKFRSSKSPDEHGSRSSNANAPHVQHDHSDGLATGPSTSRTSAEEDD
ncbi:unnamed protein product [Amoebophrya sp. A120]|nr:unnamed protein product [Amoebophrya sp. A120]|eukprot:GSA120T00020515001.1